MNKIFKTLIATAIASFMAVGSFAGCTAASTYDTYKSQPESSVAGDVIIDPDAEAEQIIGETAGFPLGYDAGLADNTEGEVNIYDGDYYYLNQLRANGADPGAMYVSPEEAGTTYDIIKSREEQYSTFDEIAFEAIYGSREDYVAKYGNKFYVATTGSNASLSAETEEKYPGFSYAAYNLKMSADLNNWEEAGALDGYAVLGTADGWWSNWSCWAPELKRDPVTGYYIIFFSMGTKNGNDSTFYNKYSVANAQDTAKWDRMTIGMAIAEFPVGPYRFLTAEGYYKMIAKMNENGTIAYETDDDGNNYAVYREGIKSITGEDMEGEFLTYVDVKPSGTKFLNKNMEILDSSAPPVNFGYYHEEIIARYPHPAMEGRGIFPMIDVNPMIDSKGDIYLYFSHHISSQNTGNQLWVVKLKDFCTVDWPTLTHVTTPSVSIIYNDNDTSITGYEGWFRGDEGGINEGCFVIERDGWYYMTYSPYGLGSRNYASHIAIANNPFGPFIKLPDYSPIVGLDKNEDGDYMAGTGHHCFVWAGDELYELYHAFFNPVRNTDYDDNFLGRAIGADKVSFNSYDKLTFGQIKANQIAQDKEIMGYSEEDMLRAFSTANGSNYEIEKSDDEIIPLLYGNGPTYSLQPLPEVSLPNGYRNIIKDEDCTITAIGEGVDTETLIYANDEMFTYQKWSAGYEVSAYKELKLSVKWDSPKAIKNVMIYNSRDYYTAFTKVSSIVFRLAEKPTWCPDEKYNGFCYIKDLNVDDYSFNTSNFTMRKGGSAMATFDEIKATEMIITIKATDKREEAMQEGDAKQHFVRLSEIYVMGK